MKKVVLIGGGHGLSLLVRAMKPFMDVELAAIVTVADDGGSTGRLRQMYQIPAMGDIRNVMCAMGESETLFSKLMNYRFEGENIDVGGHNLGNLILTALTHQCGNFIEAIQMFSKVMNVSGDIIPSSSEVITLYAKMSDGTIVKGESNIPNFDNRIEEVFYDHDVKATRQAIKKIKEADIIIYGVGSLYTSVIPNLIITEIKEALQQSKAKKIYICNAMTQPGETDHYSVEDHVNALLKHTGSYALDYCITHNNVLSDKIIQKYSAMHATEVKIEEKEHNYSIYQCDLLKFDNDLVRHSVRKMRKCLESIIYK